MQMKTIKAVVGIIHNTDAKILIAKRQDHQFMGGYWELPGGKIEPNETQEAALTRELREELGIEVNQLSLYQTMVHQYEDRLVELYIYNIDQYQHAPRGVEGQEIAWSTLAQLQQYPLLPTMRAFINTMTLPHKYWITPSTEHQSKAWLSRFEQQLDADIELIQLRSKSPLDSQFIADIYAKCRQKNVKLLLNIPNKTFATAISDGWHLSTAEMQALDARPCADEQLLGASTHNLSEALQAQEMGADFVVISPVQATQTHPDTTPIGWDVAKEVVDRLNIPVYFLGGMTLADLDRARALGAQGIAGGSAF